MNAVLDALYAGCLAIACAAVIVAILLYMSGALY
jgi:hypothetical protein